MANNYDPIFETAFVVDYHSKSLSCPVGTDVIANQGDFECRTVVFKIPSRIGDGNDAIKSNYPEWDFRSLYLIKYENADGETGRYIVDKNNIDEFIDDGETITIRHQVKDTMTKSAGKARLSLEAQLISGDSGEIIAQWSLAPVTVTIGDGIGISKVEIDDPKYDIIAQLSAKVERLNQLVQDITDFTPANYITKADATKTYLTKTDAYQGYATKPELQALASSKADTTTLNNYLTQTSASNIYLSKTSAEDTYLKLTQASNAYLGKIEASAYYLKKADAQSLYYDTDKLNTAMANYAYSKYWIDQYFPARSELANYVQSDTLTSTLNSYYTKAQVDNLIAGNTGMGGGISGIVIDMTSSDGNDVSKGQEVLAAVKKGVLPVLYNGVEYHQVVKCSASTSCDRTNLILTYLQNDCSGNPAYSTFTQRVS